MGIDSGHWYTREGRPFYTVLSKDGTERGVTLRDARKINAVPSVTTVLQVLAKPQLEVWKVKQGILAALTLPRADDEQDEAYIARVLADSREQAKAAAEEGTRIHDACECAMKGTHYPDAYVPHVEAASAKLAELFPGVTDWIAEASFAHPDGFGGKVDLHSPSTGIVVDYKGKDGDFTEVDAYGKPKKLGWDQHFQLGGYQRGLLLPSAPCANIFISRTHPGKVAHHLWTREEVSYGADMFELLLAVWKHAKRYESGFQLEQAA